MLDRRHLHRSSVVRSFLIASILASSSSAAPLTIRIGTTARCSRANVEVREAGSLKATMHVVAATDGVSVDVRPGLYEVKVAEPDCWAAPATVYVNDRAAIANLMVYPVSSVHGRFASPRPGTTPPARLTARFEAAAEPLFDAAGLTGEVECTIDSLTWRCAVPAGRLDIAVKAPGHVSRFWWNVDTTNSDVMLGTLHLRPGASLVGRVAVPPSHAKAIANMKVRLTPIRAGRSRSAAADEQIAMTIALTTKPNRRGQFVFDGLTPGGYVLDAVADKLTARAQTVRIIDGAEAELREPLLLEPPNGVSVLIDPPLDPWKRMWILRLERRTGVETVVHTERQGRANDRGSWTAEGLPSGEYILNVETENEDRWYSGDVSISGDTSPIRVAIPRLRLRGTVSLGGQPLRAEITLDGRIGASIRTISDEQGRFGMYFPSGANPEEVVTVEVTAPAANVQTKLEGVRLEGDGYDRTLTIDLPATAVTGEVLDERGQAVFPATVTARCGDCSVTDVEVQRDGTFRVEGLPPGPVQLRARAPLGMSDAATAELSPDADSPPFVQLVVRAGRSLHGRVLSAAGSVPGALVSAFPRPTSAFLIPLNATDASGSFSVHLPPDVSDVDVRVAAPGFATRIFRHHLNDDPLEIHVAQNGGALSVIAELRDDEREPIFEMTHRGATFRLNQYLFRGAAIEQDGRSWRSTVPDLEPGEYVVCRRATGVCASTSVAPFATARIELTGGH